MEYYREHNTEKKDVAGGEVSAEDIMSLLYSMKRTKQNHALLTEYFLEQFTINPEKIIEIMRLLKVHLEDSENRNREKLARRYLGMFSFLCERFWLYQDKLDLDDLCFSITHPVEYKTLKKKLEKYQKKSEEITEQIHQNFHVALDHISLGYSIKGRYKHIYSIYKKIHKKKTLNLQDLGDIFAFRIIIEGWESDCYDVLNILHNVFHPLPMRFKDYIKVPKINGYQSIHSWLLWVSWELEIPIEVQIRTQDMDIVAESWVAAHYHYAKNKTSQKLGEKEQKLLQHIDEVTKHQQTNLFVYCLTPHWDIKKMTYGSNIRDFAAKIHSNFAEKAKNARVNNIMQRMTYKIKNFDTIELITT